MNRIVVSEDRRAGGRPIIMSAELFARLMVRARAIHARGWKSYGVFLAPDEPHADALRPVDVYFCDPRLNRRNDTEHRAAFEAQGAYFRRHHDAGFVADARDVRVMEARARRERLVIVAPFHTHRRQPANFSVVDYALHNPFFGWHLVISLRDAARIEVQPFAVEKDIDDYGLDPDAAIDDEGEVSYAGPEVSARRLEIEGSASALASVERMLGGGRGAGAPAISARDAVPRVETETG